MNKIVSKCRLCLSQSASFLNIFSNQTEGKTIATIITQHFWFEVKNDDDSIKDICHDCWAKVEDFHLFYTKVYDIHATLLSKVDIKREIVETLNTKEIDIKNTEINNTDLAKQTNVDQHDVLHSDMEVEWSGSGMADECSSDNYTVASNSDNDIKNKNDDEFTSLPSALKQNGNKRKTKRIQTKKETDPAKKAKFEFQNKQISDYFSMDCDMCPMKLDNFRILQLHYRLEHKTKGYVRCCNKKYIKRGLILEHLGRHLNPETFDCEICNKKFVAKRSLELHMRSHLPSEERPFKCPECPKTYVIANLLKRHLETHATERKFVCGECGKSFVAELQLKSHQRSMHVANIYICDVCAKPFRSKDTFKKHHMSVHGKVPLPKVQCQICSAWVSHKYYLKKHMAGHAENKTSFPCNICGKSTPNAAALQCHNRVVHTEKVHTCSLCEKTFKRSISLKEHMAFHTGVILYSCSYCPKTFNSSANMYTHRKKSHKKEWEEHKLGKHKANSAI